MKLAARRSLWVTVIAFHGGCRWEALTAIAPGASGGDEDGGGTTDSAELDEKAPSDAPLETDAVVDAQQDAAADVGISIGDGDVTSSPCNRSMSPLRAWTFDSDTEGWVLLPNSSVSGSSSVVLDAGDPSPGALEVEITSLPGDASTPNGGWVEYQAATPLGDLSGRVVSAWIWLEAGPTPNLKVFVQTGTEYTWADNGTVHLLPHVWTCVSLAVSNPSYTNGPSYDPQDVVRLGLELLGPAPFQIFVDSVEY
jgi:hypothetical protein